MMMVELTSVSSAALPVAELTDHLRLATGFADDGSQDGQLESCLRAALSSIEARIGKALYQRRFAWQLSKWQSDEVQALPLAPVESIESIKVISRSGVETVLDSDRYVLRSDTHRPDILGLGGALPSPSQGGTIEIEFTAGYSADWSGVPADLRQAVMIQAAEFYGGRADHDTGLPFAVTVLIEPYRAIRLRGGTT
ncbi:hypothetical protein E2K80_03090 [Rhodophyticola sp. CCM32]|uniref:head-tail connector protein n=1 Tax=Rhodophyticola sp. CCM32 TaxID=2916397 RepID=UPI00107F6BB1|nr:hypothetical protein [Rhodophyticola sp. CCM32]QBX99841.1 hypothetical protein E2K80_03090 [Rhodophyticola sp. CCM32]